MDPILTTRSQPRRAVAIVALGLLWTACTGADPAPDATPTTVSPDRFEPSRRWIATGEDWEPALAVDPDGGFVYQLTTRIGGHRACSDCPHPAIVSRVSSDGGQSWGPDIFVCECPGVTSQADPQVEVLPDGTALAVWLNIGSLTRVVAARSQDQGETWDLPVLANANLGDSDRPVLLVDPGGRDIYIAFSRGPSYVVASHDGGAHFGSPGFASFEPRAYFNGGGAIGPDGALYFSQTAYGSALRRPISLKVVRSDDDGRTWRERHVETLRGLDCPYPPCREAFFLGPQTSIVVDTGGTVVLAYNARREEGSGQAVFVRTSSDRGETWGEPIEVSSSDPGVRAAFPALAAGPDEGDIRLVFQDDRTGRWNTWYRRSRDGGKTWEDPVRLSVGGDAPYRDADGFAFPFGDYVEIELDADGTAHVTWGEGTRLHGQGDTWYARQIG